MNRRSERRGRTKVGATIDADLLDTVDRFVADHPGTTRSEVFDDALRLWAAQERERALEAQYGQSDSIEDAAEQDDWRRIRRAAATARLF